MEIKCLSVRNPLSYLICAGLKDVENRSKPTKFRGRVFIHSSGPSDLAGVPDFSDFPLDWFNEMRAIDEKKIKLEDSRYFEPDGKGDYKSNPSAKKDSSIMAQRVLYSLGCQKAAKGNVFFRTRAIIGHVDIVDCVKGHPSKWSEPDCYQWVLANPVLFDKPVVHVKGKLSFWNYNLEYTLKELQPLVVAELTA